MTEATARMQKGSDSLADLPGNSWRVQQELDLQITLARALMATKGHSAPAVAETIARARALAEQCDRPDRLVSVLYFQQYFHVVRDPMGEVGSDRRSWQSAVATTHHSGGDRANRS